MKSKKILLKNEEETLSFGTMLASILKPADIIILTGDLGVGKTKLTQGILRYFHLEDEISSPTFNIVNEYQLSNSFLYHFDVYRLADSSEFLQIGGDEYLEKGICIIEWGEMILDVLPAEYLQIIIEKDEFDNNKRILTILAHGSRYISYLSKIS